MPLFSAKVDPASKKQAGQLTPEGNRHRRIYSDKEIENMIMALPRDLQVRTLSVYEKIGKLEATSALSNIRQARQDIQQLDRELQTMKDEEADRLKQAAADPANLHTVISFRRPVKELESQQLKLEDETGQN